MKQYEIAELLPIIAELSEKYTSKESTSITYERAQQLMEAVLYCIQHCESENELAIITEIPAQYAYQWGREKVVEKVKRTQHMYNEMMESFVAYGNKNYYDTVTKAIPGFFLHYDVQFAPQDTIITMDYPVLSPSDSMKGIDAIEKYVEALYLEQKFLHKIPTEYVQKILYQFHEEYQSEFFNVGSILLRNLLGGMLIRKPWSVAGKKLDYDKLSQIVAESSCEKLEQELYGLLKLLIEQEYDGDRALYDYLKNDVKDYRTELFFGKEWGCMDKKVVL